MTKIQHRRDTATNWTTVNPVLSAGEIGVELDTLKFKIGDGTTAWVNLKYQSENIDLSDYALKTDLPDTSKLVTTDTNQKITASKRFYSGFGDHETTISESGVMNEYRHSGASSWDRYARLHEGTLIVEDRKTNKQTTITNKAINFTLDTSVSPEWRQVSSSLNFSETGLIFIDKDKKEYDLLNPTVDLSNYATKDDLDNISVKTDNTTIVQDSDKTISAIGIKDKNGNSNIYTWSGTKAQYDIDLANGKITSETICNITDDEEIIPSFNPGDYYKKDNIDGKITSINEAIDDKQNKLATGSGVTINDDIISSDVYLRDNKLYYNTVDLTKFTKGDGSSINGYVTVENNIAKDFWDGTTAKTVLLKTSSTPGNDLEFEANVTFMTNPSNNDGKSILFTSAPANISLAFTPSNVTLYQNNTTLITKDVSLKDNDILKVYFKANNAGNILKLWVNGVLTADETSSTQLTQPIFYMVMRLSENNTNYWAGTIDLSSVRIKSNDVVRFNPIQEKEFKAGGSGLEVCDIGTALYIDETKGLRRWLNGTNVTITENTQEFLNKLKSIKTVSPSLFLDTVDQWEAEKLLSVFGQVGKFVINEEDGFIRLPRVVNIQGLQDLQQNGMRVDQSLPAHTHTRGTMNITGWFGYQPSVGIGCGGCFTTQDNGYNTWTWGSSRGDGSHNTVFNASASWTGSTSFPNNATYIDGAPVQPETVQYPYFIQIATGQETQVDIVNEIELNNPYSLFDSKYSQYPLNNVSWLKSEGQYNDGNVYSTVYQALLVEMNAEVAVETKVTLPNGTEYVKKGVGVKSSIDTFDDYDFVVNTSDVTFRLPIKTIYADSSTNNLLLYYYVGETVQNANLIDIGRMSETLNSPTRGYLVESYKNGNSWYRVYSDGWCEQGGYISMYNTGTNITLLKQYTTTNYAAFIAFGGTTERAETPAIYSKTNSSFKVAHKAGLNNEFGLYWTTKGYIR